MKVIRIGCDLSNQCVNYKRECGNCRENWEIEWETRDQLESYEDDGSEDEDYED